MSLYNVVSSILNDNLQKLHHHSKAEAAGPGVAIQILGMRGGERNGNIG